MDDLLGRAIQNYQNGDKDASLIIHNKYGKPDIMPIEVYFRQENDLSDLEQFALSLAQGRVLEVGAGAGSLCLILQDMALEVDAIEISPLCVEVMRQRGVKSIIETDFFEYEKPDKYDTIFLLMNGLGLVGYLGELENTFRKLKNMLTPTGQIIFDSSDVAYLYDEPFPGNKYYGEIAYCYEYKGERSDWFNWLYVDFETMGDAALSSGLQIQLIQSDDSGQYLARAVL
jgi:SAM-dependent methyltransferase